jgi:L-alanine-DL-glutamate epimerase-like enolase superfamily enzyme
MAKATDVRVVATSLHFLEVKNRIPLKFGPETTTEVTCARACVRVADRNGRTAEGWGETPLNVQWVWPSSLPYATRHERLKAFSHRLAEAWAGFPEVGHAAEVGYDFKEHHLPALRNEADRAAATAGDVMPWLAALVCCSPFDIALHDAYGQLLGRPMYETYTAEFMNRDLAAFLTPVPGARVSFAGKYPRDFLVARPPSQVRAWHLVGGLDLLDPSERTGKEPDDGYPVVLPDWIRRDGLRCLKVKLRGADAAWDYDRILRVGRIAIAHDVDWLSADFNCTVREPEYVTALLDRLRDEAPRIFGMLLYVEQPFPYDLEAHQIDVRAISARKPLFLDESAHDWRVIRLGRELGWSGVALKTCKTQTEALLSCAWARAHGMTLMVQDLSNPMLAQIPHVLLAANVGTIMGVETNGMQFYPAASRFEAAIHPGLYSRRNGVVDLSTLRGPGFGYRLQEIGRPLPPPAATFGT